MRIQNPDAAYCADRMAASTALALASTDSCARASHAGRATAYGERLAAPTYAGRSRDRLRTLERWDDEGGAGPRS